VANELINFRSAKTFRIINVGAGDVLRVEHVPHDVDHHAVGTQPPFRR